MWQPSDPEIFTSDSHLALTKRIDALRARHGYLSEHVLGPAAKKEMSNQVLRGGRLWIDGMWAAEHDMLRARNITAICALGAENDGYPEPPADVIRHHIAIHDYHYEPIKVHFEQATQFIHDQLAKPGGRVLVHCAAGVSRSATICMAYLMRYHHLSLSAAYAVVLEARCIVDPNPGFLEQLKEWENELVFE